MEIAIVLALVLGLTKVAKITGLKSQYLPLLAVVLGLIISGLLYGWNASVLLNTGLVAALSAMGLYSGVKTTIKS